MPLESSGSGASAPYFFLSYAHIPRDDFNDADPNMWVRRLFRDLCTNIQNITDAPAGGAGFMDGSMQAGQIWTEELARSLAGCRVFVPLYSPRYFNSSWCGKEWTVFGGRPASFEDMDEQGGTPSAVVPALWSPINDRQLPECAKGMQYAHPELGERYRTLGLYGLIKVKSFRGDYERAVFQLAHRIKDVADRIRVERGIGADLETAHDAFASPSARRTLRISVAAGSLDRLPEGRSRDCYGPSPLAWNPYHPESDRPLVKTAEAIAGRLDYRPVVQELDHHSGPADGPEILLLDRWVLSDPEHREQLRKLDNDHTRPTGLAVPWNDADPDNKGARQELVNEVEEAMPQMAGRQRPALRSAALGIPDHGSFSSVLPKVVAWAAKEYLRNAAASPPQGTGTERFRVGDSGGQTGRQATPSERRGGKP